MLIHILDQSLNEVLTIDEPKEIAIPEAQRYVREEAMRGVKLTAVDDEGESVFDADFESLLQFIPHGRRIAAGMMDRMAKNPAEFYILVSGSPKIADLITSAITDYFQKQIAIGKEYLAMPEHKRQRVREQLLRMIAPQAAA